MIALKVLGYTSAVLLCVGFPIFCYYIIIKGISKLLGEYADKKYADKKPEGLSRDELDKYHEYVAKEGFNFSLEDEEENKSAM
ncbi:MAG: hypothetical protein MJ246_08120 [Clostridia bacterium]|nr:hypothetical protein [Clostridia bacterium]